MKKCENAWKGLRRALKTVKKCEKSVKKYKKMLKILQKLTKCVKQRQKVTKIRKKTIKIQILTLFTYHFFQVSQSDPEMSKIYQTPLRVRPRETFHYFKGIFYQFQNGSHYHLPHLRDAQKWVFGGPTQSGYWVTKLSKNTGQNCPKSRIMRNQL